MSNYVKPGKAEEHFGVGRRTLLKWANVGQIKFLQPSGAGGERLYDLNSVTTATANERHDVIYARVSTNKQDLKTQIDALQEAHPDASVLSDHASGLDFNRPGLNKLLRLVHDGKVKSVFVAHRTHLGRFGAELIERVLDLNDVKLVVDDSDTINHTELEDDILTVVGTLGARLHGLNCIEARKRKRSSDDEELTKTRAVAARQKVENDDLMNENANLKENLAGVEKNLKDVTRVCERLTRRLARCQGALIESGDEEVFIDV